MTELSLKKISDIMSYTSLAQKTVNNGVSVFDCTYNIELNDEGRAYFFFTDKKGLKVALDAISFSSTPLETALARVRQQISSTFSWESEGEETIYFDTFPEFAEAVFKESSLFLFRGEAVSVAKDSENARLKLAVKNEENYYNLSLILKTDSDEIENPVLLSSVYALAGGKVYRTRDMGAHYHYLSSFVGNVKKSEINLFLSLFSSMFRTVDFLYSTYKKLQHTPVRAKSALAFSDLDSEGNLSIKMLWTKDGFPVDFISENKPTTIVNVDEEKKLIEKTDLIYDNAQGWKKILAMIRATMDKHPEARDADGETFALDGDTLFLTSTIALPFLSENLGELVQYYALFGTEALKKYNLHKVVPKTKLTLHSGIDFFDTDCEITIDDDVFTPSQFVSLYEKNNFIPLSDGTRAIVEKNFFLRLKRLLGRKSKEGTYKLSFFDLPLVDSLINAKVESEKGNRWNDFFLGYTVVRRNA